MGKHQSIRKTLADAYMCGFEVNPMFRRGIRFAYESIGNTATKEDLALVVFDGDLSGVDLSVPQYWHNKAIELGINPHSYVWSYKNDVIGGEPINVVEAWFNIKIGAE